MNRREFISLTGAGVAAGFITDEVTAATAIRKYSELQYHKITDIKFAVVRLDLPRIIGCNTIKGTPAKRIEESVHILYTDKGATGWGLNRGSQEQISGIFEIIRGKPVSDIIQPSGGITLPELRIFDFSLYDLAGKIVRKPVYQLLGKRRPEKCTCHSTYNIDTNDHDNIIEEFKKDYELGYRQFKITTCHSYPLTDKEKGLDRLIRTTRLVTDNFPDCDIILDGNDIFTIDIFLRYLESIKGTKIYCIESPFVETINDYVKLYSWLRVNNMNPLLADGNINPDDTVLRQLGAQKIIDIFTHDIIETGFTGWIKLVQETGKMGLLASPDAGGSVIRAAYISHLAGAYGNTSTVGFMQCYSEDIDTSGYKIKKGKLIPSKDPGFGMELIKKM